MKVNTANFIKGAVGPSSFLQDAPEIAVVGRSNVGKSTFLNFLCQRRQLVKTSKKPGKTKELNYFHINEQFYLVDVPGFGYAKLSKTEKDILSKRIESYFNHSQKIAGVLYLIDCRILNSAVDEEALEWLAKFDCPVLIVLTKADKLKKLQLQRAVNAIQKNYDLPVPPIVTSSEKKIGRDAVWEQIELLLAEEDT
jgi:GTP-binding protein